MKLDTPKITGHSGPIRVCEQKLGWTQRPPGIITLYVMLGVLKFMLTLQFKVILLRSKNGLCSPRFLHPVTLGQLTKMMLLPRVALTLVLLSLLCLGLSQGTTSSTDDYTW